MEIYDFSVRDINGKSRSLERYRGKVLLIVNIATSCGLTPQMSGLEELYRRYRQEGFEILGFPCNQFGGQNAQDGQETASFCSLNYGVSFENFEKIKVNGEGAHPLFVFLREKKPKDKNSEKEKGLAGKLLSLRQKFGSNQLNWNFTKFLVDRQGGIAERYSPLYTPQELEEEVKKLL